METTTTSNFWPVISACAGGVIVLVGLLMEVFSEKKWFKNVQSRRRWETINQWGEWLVIIGVLIEVVDAAFAANGEWKIRQMEIANDPRKQPLSTITAIIEVEYRTNNVETNRDDIFTFMSITNDSPFMSLYLRTYPGEMIGLTPIGGGHFPENRIEAPDNNFIYVKRFDWDAAMRQSERFGQTHKQTNDILGNVADSAANFSIMHLPFRYKTEVTGGKVELFFNGSIKRVLPIPPQWVGSHSEVTSDTNPFEQRQLGATNWSFLDTNGILTALPLPPPNAKSVTHSGETWYNVRVP